ncbi:hypothetical protein [Agrobacterium tumefaciens]|uniref:hypothetical protein n=1 Tax=Agrobacterium tumefaciens TaxID=358 RepID=UPI001572F7DE|nr:hypothetical protein [Agrobacterium tumefaciens]MEA1842786.1 hypothetical protein [Agrobacterium tumefaciens]WCK20078.1 hypothetical protein G6M09_013510 [Agrobacterium tumefaciens]
MTSNFWRVAGARLMLDLPTPFWCVRLGAASDDSSARERSGSAIQTKLMAVRKQTVGSSNAEDPVGAISVPAGVGMTEFHHFGFKGCGVVAITRNPLLPDPKRPNPTPQPDRSRTPP